MSRESSTVRKLARNTGWLLLQAAGSKLLSFALNIIVVRYLGTAGYGELSFAMAFAGFFTILGDFGLSTYAIKEVSAEKTAAPEIFGRGLAINIFFSAFIALLLLGAGAAAGIGGRALLCIFLIGVSYLLHQTGAFLAGYFRAHEKMSLMFATESLYRLVLLLFCWCCVLLRLGLPEMASAYMAASAVYLAVVLLLVARTLRLRPAAGLRDYAGMLRDSAPYGLSSAALIVYYNADIVMLSFFKGAGAVGVYSAAYNLYLSLGVVTSIYMGAAFPVLARLFKSSPEGIRTAYRKSLKFLLIIAVPVSFGAVLLSSEIMTFLYGREFSPAAAPFAILASVTPFFYLNAFFGHFFAAAGKIRDSFVLFCAACLLNVGLNLLLIPRYGYIGAAVSTVVSETLYFALAAVYFSRTEYHFMPWGLIARLLFFSAVMTAVLRMFSGAGVFVLAGAGALMYALMVLLGGVLDREDVALIKEAFRP